jgi:hypothetical protein
MQALECAKSACICIIIWCMFSSRVSLVGVGVVAWGGPIGGPCAVLGRVFIAGCIVRGVLGMSTMIGEERDDEFSAVAESSQ